MPFRLPPRYFQIARRLGAAGQHDGVELPAQLLHIHVHADVRVGDKLHPFGFHLRQAAIDQVLLQA